MQEHVVYYFSGTGNSLKTALTIQKALGCCDVVSMCSSHEHHGEEASIGFVFPCYFGGVPHQVLEFIRNMELPGDLENSGASELPEASKAPGTSEFPEAPGTSEIPATSETSVAPEASGTPVASATPHKQASPYVYAIVTYGAILGSTFGQLNEALKSRGIELNYVAPLKSFANYVVMYEMSSKASEMLVETKASLQPIIADILAQKTTKIKKPLPLLKTYNRLASRNVHTQDRNFVVRESCTSCATCERVCPAGNIELAEGRPLWLGQCEQCMACLQWCPERAIDYGEKTQKRDRYTNPEITVTMFIDYLHGAGMHS